MTLIESLLAQPGGFGSEADRVRAALTDARKAYDAGDSKAAFAAVAALVEQTAEPFRKTPPQPAPPFALQATVYRDVYGVPHIYADSEEAAAYAIAQAQCEDLGMQVFRSLRSVSDAWPKSPARKPWNRIASCTCGASRKRPRAPGTRARCDTRRFLQAFCDGLNDYRRKAPGRMPRCAGGGARAGDRPVPLDAMSCRRTASSSFRRIPA